ncbi:papain fold toxin domain-containing protein [Pannus brasiliensis CCIBt3594]|uniref:Papain fold toxin domain-containing protein n=1 Tax=Pannus brasiliensis CCIBt3594 TaxID=1427578 RepID=A0AAW9QY73_9CHRO
MPILSDDELHQEITAIARRFRRFKCTECVSAIRKRLLFYSRTGKIIKLYTGDAKGKYGYIYHEVLEKTISTNGKHFAIIVVLNNQELVFDNLHSEGLPLEEWLKNFNCIAMDLCTGFQITEIDFNNW